MSSPRQNVTSHSQKQEQVLVLMGSLDTAGMCFAYTLIQAKQLFSTL